MQWRHTTGLPPTNEDLLLSYFAFLLGRTVRNMLPTFTKINHLENDNFSFCRWLIANIRHISLQKSEIIHFGNRLTYGTKDQRNLNKLFSVISRLPKMKNWDLSEGLISIQNVGQRQASLLSGDFGLLTSHFVVCLHMIIILRHLASNGRQYQRNLVSC